MEKRFFALVELMGRNKIAGEISEHNIGGQFIRVDVPTVKGQPAFTKLFSPSSIYAITPISHGTCIEYAQELMARPLDEFQMEKMFNDRMNILIERGALLVGSQCESSFVDENDDSDFYDKIAGENW